MIFGVIAALLPLGVGIVFTAFPYLFAMIVVLFYFLKKNKRAPTPLERNKIALGFIIIFFLYNALYAVFGPVFFSMGEPEVWANWFKQMSNPQFLFAVFIPLLIYMIPLYLVTFWFYGKQAHRMSNKMFN
ncbi:hypothetical protein KPC_2340 [Acinetobacter stercoris]|uniref:Uncharacterized protein n=2 Tax=Acinetobacter stercoris TaxID=2126983 RepID=A0A2U3N0G9_9GAMM|nr:hypothetical protein KPC_2340 [Acinetobacter stercoris]